MSKFKRVSRKVAYENQWISVFEDVIKRAEGEGIYAVVKRPDAVTICVSSPSGLILMLNSFRYPTGEWSLELPMGAIDAGETPEAAAARELREETGVVDAGLTLAGCFYALPGLSDQRVYVFTASAAEESLRSADPAAREEDLGRAAYIPELEISDLIKQGRITDSLTLCSLFFSGVHIARNLSGPGS
ncbi:NUDIX hydrolase [Nonomuraea glycinis]|uniref:NUDIX hydrolase n=1 Tax=Nonomuraea glycinis TaxID=2047744 RepID=UPI002E15C38B|nr:NUDIX hydrolase [Nonomuraea glycinis]